MTKLIDLTHIFTGDMPVYPGDPCSRLYQTCTVEKDGFTDHKIESHMHAGTHMDAPLHMLEGGAYISELPLAHFTGRGHLIDARKKQLVEAACLDGHNVKEGDIVLVWTGWSEKFRHPGYYEGHPEISGDFAEKLVEIKASIIGLDTPSPDSEPFPVHKILLKNNVLIIENLTNLEALAGKDSFTIHAYPIKYEADAAPVRVVAEIKDEL
jgi:kynurenine formamidase